MNETLTPPPAADTPASPEATAEIPDEPQVVADGETLETPPLPPPPPCFPPRPQSQRDVINRLRRIEGQVRGLIDMVQRGRGCEDVAQQMAAARRAMDKAFYRMMAGTVIEAVSDSELEINTFQEVERSTRILEKYA
ncbi:metal-sensing transcriptional repressor [Hydrogenophaga sp. BPS33]|uniref:metal-sensing transcriptional repressor n=1 Tax=Hydrogenophaga sp. BPS33 TaxID=2651974 RepID=UPI00131F4F08|nr:metal-sensing transcriptional repressor [Hydrogenophaga sp. BPS33]QHE84240.1 metal-sensing transcriptional repressor [Hydrogenophaga sp. BPS33]